MSDIVFIGFPFTTKNITYRSILVEGREDDCEPRNQYSGPLGSVWVCCSQCQYHLYSRQELGLSELSNSYEPSTVLGITCEYRHIPRYVARLHSMNSEIGSAALPARQTGRIISTISARLSRSLRWWLGPSHIALWVVWSDFRRDEIDTHALCNGKANHVSMNTGALHTGSNVCANTTITHRVNAYARIPAY